MDADGLPLIGPSVDYQQVAPIDQRKTVEYLNQFIIHTAGLLNRFSTVCEEKLVTLSTRIERLQTQMTLLEGKINSIPGLENVTASNQVQPTTTQSAQITSTVPPAPTSAAIPEKSEKTETSSVKEIIKEPETEATDVKNTIQQDTQYAKYFKMLSIGVPLPAVKQKMLLEGLNPDLIHTPNAPMPAANKVQTPQPVSDEDDFSHEEDSTDGSADFSD